MEKELEKMKEALEDFGKKVVDALKKGKGEADKATRVAQLRIEIGSLNRQVGDLFRELGELFYRNYNKPGKAAQEQLVETVGHIAAIERNIAGLKREIKAVRSEKTPAGKTAGQTRKVSKGRVRKPGTSAKRTSRKTAPTSAPETATSSETPKRRGRPPKAKTE
jgi:predicted  nucleic acid-binding Zn-ribbon protein